MNEPMVQVYCRVERQVADDVYVAGETYVMPLARAEKYAAWFDIQNHIEGDDLDRMTKNDLTAHARAHGIELPRSLRRVADIREHIREFHRGSEKTDSKAKTEAKTDPDKKPEE
jgi:hypothetical protein